MLDFLNFRFENIQYMILTALSFKDALMELIINTFYIPVLQFFSVAKTLFPSISGSQSKHTKPHWKDSINTLLPKSLESWVF